MVSRGQLELGQCINAGVAHGTPASWTGCANDAVVATNTVRTGTRIRLDLCLTMAPSFRYENISYLLDKCQDFLLRHFRYYWPPVSSRSRKLGHRGAVAPPANFTSTAPRASNR